jgi:carboxymethylenebutenolidase
MERSKPAEYPQEVFDLFDKFVHGDVSRREFIDRSAKLTVGGLSGAALLASLTPDFARAQQVPRDDSRIHTERVDYPSPQGSGTMRGYLARPAKAAGKLPAVIVIHENRGLNPYIEDVARRLAVEGYLAFAPDALAPVGGYPGDEDKAREMFMKLDAKKRTEDLMAAVPYVKSRPEAGARLGAVGFCFGGMVVSLLAARFPEIAAVSPYYGGQPTAEETGRIKAALLIHYAGNDARINGGWPAWEDVLKLHDVKYTMHMYPGTQHGFHNDTTPRYDEAAAKLAWSRTLAFFRTHLQQ